MTLCIESWWESAAEFLPIKSNFFFDLELSLVSQFNWFNADSFNLADFFLEDPISGFLPPEAQADEGEDDDEDGRHGGADGHHDHLAVDLALTSIVVPGAPEMKYNNENLHYFVKPLSYAQLLARWE